MDGLSSSSCVCAQDNPTLREAFLPTWAVCCRASHQMQGNTDVREASSSCPPAVQYHCQSPLVQQCATVRHCGCQGTEPPYLIVHSSSLRPSAVSAAPLEPYVPDCVWSVGLTFHPHCHWVTQTPMVRRPQCQCCNGDISYPYKFGLLNTAAARTSLWSFYKDLLHVDPKWQVAL